MTSQPVEANVTLTADTSGYNASINQSAANTDQFGKSIDTLTSKVDRLTKSAGRKLAGFATADVAGITAATAAYAAYERQMTSLSAQAAILNKNMGEQKTTFNSYATSVNNLRGEFGTTTRDAAELVQTLSKLSDGTVSVDRLAKSFTKLGAATGESSAALSQSMLQLQRSMGTPQRQTEQYNNTLAVLSANSTASAGSILQFAQQLAPVGRMVNMSQTDIMGVSSAFQKAGQDGYQAANVFSKMMTDVAYASQTGSPDLAKYANLVGMTVSQFKDLGGTDQFLKVFDSINRQGPAAITTLNRMGLDGMRTVRTVTAMAQQSGGLQDAIAQARGADPGALNRGSKAANDTIVESLAKLRSELTMTAESMGSVFQRPAKVFINTLGSMASVAHDLVSGPLGKMAMVVAGIAAPFAAVAATVLTASKALVLFSAANAALRNSSTFGFREGRAGKAALGAEEGMGPVGTRINERGNFIARGMYQAGHGLGRQFQPGFEEPNFVARSIQAGGRGLGYTAMGAGNLAGFGARAVGYQYAAGRLRGLDDPTNRMPFFKSPTVGGAFRNGYDGVRTAAADASFATRDAVVGAAGRFSVPTRLESWAKEKEAQQFVRKFDPNDKEALGKMSQARWQSQASDAMAGKRFAATAAEAEKLEKAMAGASKSTMSFSEGVARGASALGRGVAAAGGNMGEAALGAGATGMRFGGKLMAGLGLNPYILGAGAVIGGALAIHKSQDQGTFTTPDNSGAMNPYLQAGGLTQAATFSPSRTAALNNTTVTQAMHVSSNDAAAAADSGYKMTNPQLKGKTVQQALTMLQPQFARGKTNPATLTAIAADLSHVFGAGTANEMMRQLQTGQGSDPSSFIKSAMNQPSKNFFAHYLAGGAPDKNKVSNQFSYLFGAQRDAVNEIASDTSYSDDNAQAIAAAKLQFNQFGSTAQKFGQMLGPGGNPQPIDSKFAGPGTKQQLTQPNRTERIAYLKGAFRSQFGSSVHLSEDEAERFTIDPNAKSANQAARSLMDQVFTKGTPDKLQNEILDRYNLNKGLTGKRATSAVMDAMQGGNLDPGGPSVEERVKRLPGGELFQTKTVQKALEHTGDSNAQIQAINQMTNSLIQAGKSAPEITRLMGNIKASVKDDSNQNYYVANAVQQQAQRFQGYAMPTLSRTGQVGAQVSQFKNTMLISKGDAHQQEEQQAAVETLAGNAESERQYFVGLLYQQREFEVSRKRAYSDFNLQRTRMDYEYNLQRGRAEADFHQQQAWNAHDFHLMRSRAEFDFNLQRGRAEDDYALQQKRSRQDFNLGRLREEKDYQHQVTLMVKQAAEQYSDIYKRTQVQRTVSGNFLVFNANEQLKQMQDQEKNLSALRKAGVSDDAIQQMGLTDPNNAQQLARLVGDVASDPSLVKKFNQAIAERLKAASKLTTDESSQQWEEFNRQYRLARARGKADFDKQVNRSNEDFQKSMARQEKDFGRSLDRQQKDYETAQERASSQFSKSMDRSAEDYNTATTQMTTDFHTQMVRAANDLERSAKTIDGNLSDILSKASKTLGTHARHQAAVVRNEFQDLFTSTTGISKSIMTQLAAVFGVKYTAPKTKKLPDYPGISSPTGGMENSPLGFAAGGVLPGYTPGRDVHHYYSPTGGKLSLSGGEAIMRPEWTRAVGGPQAVKEMNEAAQRGQSFATGGTFKNPDGRANWGGKTISRIAAAQLSLAEHISGRNLYLMQGGFGGSHVAASGTSHNYPGVGDVAPGSISVEKLLRQVGFAAWARNVPGRSSVGSGAHVHAVSLVDPGDRSSPQVYGSWARHGNGLSGANNDPAPHYAWIPNLLARLNAVNLTGIAGSAAGGDSGATLDSILKSYYRKPESQTAAMAGVHVLQQGMISGIINRFARARYQKMVAHYGDPYSIPMGSGSVMSGDPHDPTSSGRSPAAAQQAGRQMAAARGWTGSNWDSLYKLWMRESGWRWNADNPSSSAYGIPQSLPGSKMASAGGDWRTNPVTQIKWGLGYIKDRYGNPNKAWAHSQNTGWYGDGGVFTSPQKIGVGERGPEMVLPLNDRGAEFITGIMQKMMAGNEGRATRTSGFQSPATVHNMHNYKIDRSTTFSGPISVQANNPNELMAQLRTRARTSALTNAAKGGVKIA